MIVTVALGRLFLLLLLIRRRRTAQPDMDAPTEPATLAFHHLATAMDEGSQRQIQLQGNGPATARWYTQEFWKAILKVGLLVGTYIGFIICAICTAYLASDSKALSSDGKCGIYIPSANSTPAQDLQGPYAFHAQLDSAQLVVECYHAPPGADGCNFFVEERIQHKNKSVPCPFPGGMCHGDTAFQFTTGAVGAAALGIHTSCSFESMRETACAPLNGNSTFILASEEDGVSTQTYHYGPRGGNSFTWQNQVYTSNLDLQAHYLVE